MDGSNPITWNSLIEAFGSLGGLGGVIAYFVWRDSRTQERDNARSDRLEKRVEELETYQRNNLHEVTLKTTEALVKSFEAIEFNSEVIHSNTEAMREFVGTMKEFRCPVQHGERKIKV